MEPLQPTSVVRFGTYEVSLQSGDLRKAGLRIKVQQQPMKLLEVLLERPGELVTREELRTRVWPNESFGDFDQALNIAIGKLRSALGDSAENPRFIETLPKRGYRFIADVSVVDTDTRPSRPEPVGGDLSGSKRESSKRESPEPGSSERESPERKAEPERRVQGAGLTLVPVAPKRQQRVIAALALVILVTLSILSLWLFRSRGPAPTGIRSLAVLPLENLSGDASQNYFADGMTDELITDLAQISALRVISRTSVMAYKGARKPLPQIARELNVDAVVEGTVLRAGEQVRITAQLIEASTDKHLWSQSYEGDLRDTLTLQKKVASAIADQIRINLTPQEQAALKSVKTVNPEAYESYLKGRYFWNKRTGDGLKVALAYFNQAIEEDPKYAQAYSGLADTYALLGDWQYAVMTPREAFPKAKAEAIKALELDSSLGEAHNSLAFVLDGFDWDFDSAGKEFQRAIALNPGYATAHHWYAWHLSLLGRYDEAIAEMRKASSVDPLSLIINADLAELLVLAHSYDEAIRQSGKTIEMDPNFALAHNQLGQAYLQKHMYDQAIAELQKAVQLSEDSPISIANLARAYIASGKRSEAVKLLAVLKNRSNSTYSNAAEIAMIYASLGDVDQAVTWLEKGYEERFNPGVLLRPGFDPLRSDPRFQNLVHRIGLPG
ncbi:MAG TPA: tetratricopeptide repeat protein [Terriglobales bacterium]|jgi:TolB-like protein/DNA-binding winged helix-turn-helix (wHTH) protein/Tfp pilus assembly protein PilF|nr:tetratricopeptide repeat protein [Terriglobales bacterium]